MEANAKPYFERLTSLYQIALLVDALDDTSAAWINPALGYLKATYAPDPMLQKVTPLSTEEVERLLAWDI
jgi:hypothetical protein